MLTSSWVEPYYAYNHNKRVLHYYARDHNKLFIMLFVVVPQDPLYYALA